ncbi:aspartate--tRNA ligase [[Mycoplasma] gypis]|uniref:Aspartate--tRNA ligase n=1 Tax=[Mycoplasma] gypis TaxID=92404 RepID=A0ABZ2RR21_9BACT|nr:aspartate--tRNA ligase [[Mycoplasma] gypis]MBN0919303.1 aspartate--tRNA ligase [[Mycoplasma] gypis]
MKTLNNTDINTSFLNKEVTLYGWIANKRKFKKQLFVDFRDRSGLIQLVFNNVSDPLLTKESVLKVTGTVTKRLEANLVLATGEIEIQVSSYEILNSASQIPFEVNTNEAATQANEDLRLEYRFLDLRRQKMQENLALRHKVSLETRKFFDSEGFLEIETPVLCKSTPEGARDFLVPTRRKGKFFALPQSPQLYKQLLMGAGFEKYFQIARVFRDEDLRKDRQPEFTQIDFEMSFATEEDLFLLVERYYSYLFKQLGLELQTPFKRMDFFESMDKYGNDKPDTRFEFLLTEASHLSSTFESVKFINFNQDFFEYEKYLKEIAQKNNAKDFALVEVKSSQIIKTSAFGTQIDESLINAIIKEFKITDSFLLVSAGRYKDVIKALGATRTTLNELFNLADPKQFNFLWIVNWPMFELNEETNAYEPAHHAFTMIDLNTLKYFETNELDKVRARSYDLVLNGFELGSGSVRIHDPQFQARMFEELKMTKKEYESKFGFFLKAFKYGLPPHCGMAFGLERILMILTNSQSIRDVIAFPKNAKGLDLLSNSPSDVTKEQLDEYYLSLNK